MQQDILLSLLGFPSDFIVECSAALESTSVESEGTFRVKDGYANLDDSEREQINRIVPLGWYYNYLQGYTQKYDLSWGRVGEATEIYKLALGGAVQDLLQEYVDDVADLESILNEDERLPLSHFIHHLQKYMIVFPQLHAILKAVEESKLRGCQIVDFFAKYACGIQVLSDLIDRILARLRIPLLKQIFSWMVFGNLQDEAKEFFVQMRRDLAPTSAAAEFGNMNLTKEQRIIMRLAEAEKESNKSAQQSSASSSSSSSSMFDWYSTFSLRIENIPDSHITPAIASKVIFAGKAAKLLQSSALNTQGLTKEMKENEAFAYLSRGSDLYNDDEPTSSESPTIDNPLLVTDMPYTKEEIASFDEAFQQVFIDQDRAVERLEKAIDLVCHSVSTRLWLLLKHQLGFFEYLHIIRNTYLMGKGELMQCIVDDLQVLTQQPTPQLEALDDTLNWKVVRNAGKLVGLQDEDDIHRLLHLKVHNHVLSVEKFQTNDERFISMAGVTQYQYPASTTLTADNDKRLVYNPIGIQLCLPRARSLTEHYAELWREKHIVQLHQHRHALRTRDDPVHFHNNFNNHMRSEDHDGSPWAFSRHHRQQRTSSSLSLADSRGGKDLHLVYDTTDDAHDARLLQRAQDLVEDTDHAGHAQRIQLVYTNAAVWFTEPKFVTKGFAFSCAFASAWNISRLISSDHLSLQSPRALDQSQWPSFPAAYPFPRLQDIVLGTVAACVHSDGRQLTTVGSGELCRQIAQSLVIGVSFHACVFDTSSAVDGDDETLGRTAHAHHRSQGSNRDTSADGAFRRTLARSGVKYYARIFVARGGHEGVLKLPLNKRLLVNIGDGYYRSNDPHTTTAGLTGSEAAQDYILAEKIVDLDDNLGASSLADLRSISTLTSRMQLHMSYQRVLNYQQTTTGSVNSHAHLAATLAGGGGGGTNGVGNSSGDIFQGMRERSILQNSAASASAAAGLRRPGQQSGTVGGVGNGSVHMVGEVAHRLRVRLTSDEEDTEESNNATNSHWDVDIPLDLALFVKCSNGGQAWVGTVASGLVLPDQPTSSATSSSTAPPTSVLSFHTSLQRMHFAGKGSLFAYPVCAPFTSARYPDTFLQLEQEVSRIRAWMNLRLQLQFPAVFAVIFDADSKRHYERIFGLVMKVRLVARLLERLWMARSKWITDRLYCNLRHAMHFFISNLLYYLQVDVVDSEYNAFQTELRHLQEFQAVLLAHRHFLANVLRLSMLDNQGIQENFDRLLHLCLRFVAACRIQARSEAAYTGSASVNSSGFQEENHHNHHQNSSFQSQDSRRSPGSKQKAPAAYTAPAYIPPEEFEAIRKEFFQQIAYLLQFMKKVESRGFLFRLDFNGYLSQHCMNI